jgi:hypothetical protein
MGSRCAIVVPCGHLFRPPSLTFTGPLMRSTPCEPAKRRGGAKPIALEVLFMWTQVMEYRSKGLAQGVTLRYRGAVWTPFQTPISNFYRPPRAVNPMSQLPKRRGGCKTQCPESAFYVDTGHGISVERSRSRGSVALSWCRVDTFSDPHL